MDMMETAVQAAEIAQGGTVPEWVHILPLGQIEGRDGRRFEETVIHARGSIERPLLDGEIADKTRRLASRLPAAQAS